jgi:hypothetical protein
MFPEQNSLDTSKDIGLWKISVAKEISYRIQWRHIKIQTPAVREGVNSDYSRVFYLEKGDLNRGVCSHLFGYCWRNKQTRADSDLTDGGLFFLAMKDRRGANDKHVTVPDAV